MALLKEAKSLPQRHREHREFNPDLELLILRCHSIENFNGYLDFSPSPLCLCGRSCFFQRSQSMDTIIYSEDWKRDDESV